MQYIACNPIRVLERSKFLWPAENHQIPKYNLLSHTVLVYGQICITCILISMQISPNDLALHITVYMTFSEKDHMDETVHGIEAFRSPVKCLPFHYNSSAEDIELCLMTGDRHAKEREREREREREAFILPSIECFVKYLKPFY